MRSVIALLLVACSESDSREKEDVGPDASSDAALADAPHDHYVVDGDAFKDVHVPVPDGAAETGSGGSGGGAGTPEDSGNPPPPDSGLDAEVFGDPCDCAPFSFVDHTGSASTQIQFGCCTYQPRCLRVSAGAQVTWTGPFGSHPLAASLQTDLGNPIQDTASGDSVSFTFAAAGTYGYLCTIHGFDLPLGGMCGVIEVVP